MAMHVPVVATSRVNNAIDAKPESEILIADREGVFAEQILRLLQSIDLQTLIANNGRTFVEKKYSWQGATKGLEELINHRLI
jgi:chaperone required for assembly of F1-ATPase